MDKITNNLTIPSKRPEQDSPNAQDSTRPDKVWLRLTDLYGRAHIREHGEAPGPLWRAAINRLSNQQIANGLQYLVEQGRAFPPNCPQFVAACTRPPRRPTLGTNQLLPAPTGQAAKENADKAWDRMEALAGKPLRPEEPTKEKP